MSTGVLAKDNGDGRRRCWCRRLAAHGTDYCTWHGARDPHVQLASDRRRLEARVSEWERLLAELEVRWVRAGGSPAALWRLVAAGRVSECVVAVERWEAGW